ncbi:TPA: restriction endonuclease [Candidatus Poribacteria bacterium]|nr:restriction endonuclease [Candidatus Poribacteria bacterium]
MKIGGEYSFNNGKSVIEETYSGLLDEVRQVITNVNAYDHLKKKSQEKTMSGKMLYSPISLNKAFRDNFVKLGWNKVKVKCDYTNQFYVCDQMPIHNVRGAFREMDFVKCGLGVEVQFGKYSFMVYNVAAKMTIFHNLGFINAGIEIVPLKLLADSMSTGVSFFEQFVWDLENRGVADIDIPVLVLGIIP